ncbi:MAG: DUF503 domain-containing protein [Acidobacteria bacterium]|nr:DUF503 domain-containing protein [Acidobacteriota bacterium]
MVIGVLLIELFIPGSHSLKEKRMVVKGLKDSIRSRFNVSVAEVDFHDLWQKAKIGIASIGVEGSVVDKGFSAILNFIEEKAVAEIVDTKIELL